MERDQHTKSGCMIIALIFLGLFLAGGIYVFVGILNYMHGERAGTTNYYCNEAQIPAFVKKILLENNNSEIYDRLGVETFTDYVKTYVTELVVNILAYVTTFILSYMIYRLLLAAVHLVDHLACTGH